MHCIDKFIGNGFVDCFDGSMTTIQIKLTKAGEIVVRQCETAGGNMI